MDALKLSKDVGLAIRNSKEYKEYKDTEGKVIGSPATIELLDRFNGVQALLKDYLGSNKYEEASKLKEEMNQLYDQIIDNELLNQLSIRLDKVNRLRDEIFSNIDSEIKVILKPPRIKAGGGCSGCSSNSTSGCTGCSK